MEMKKILQAIDGSSAKPAEGSSDMKKFLRIMEGNISERVSIGSAGQVQGGLTSGQPVISPSVSQEPGPLALPGSNLPKAEKADRNSNSVTIGGQTYTMVFLEPGGIRPRGGQRFALPRAMLGIRGLGNYIGVIAGDKAYILPQGEQESVQKESLFFKYVNSVEKELKESKNKKDHKIKKLSEKVIKEVGGNYGHPSRIKNHISKTMMPPENIRNMAKQGAKTAMRNEETEGVDSVTMDIPLLIRLLEFAREDAQDDMVLHQIAERLVGMAEEGQSLSMSDYENIVGQVSEAHGNNKIYDKCWTGYKKVPGKKRGEPGSCKKK